MSSAAAKRFKPILPWWQLIGLLALCAVGIWALLPDDPTLVDDLLRDGKTAEAHRLLNRLSPKARARNTAHYAYLDVRVAQLELPPNDPAALARFWTLAVKSWRDAQFSAEIFDQLAPVIPRLPDPAAAWSAVAPDFSRAPAAQQQRLVADFTKAALAASQQVTAAQIFALGHPAAGRSAADSLELAHLWELAGRPAEALAALGEDPSASIVARRVELLRQLNRNRDALTLLRTRVDAGLTLDAALAEQIATVALAANEPATAVPYLQRYVEANATDLAAVRRLRTLLLSAGQPGTALAAARQAVALSSRAPEDLRELAQILEYSGAPGPAFDLWLEYSLLPRLADRDRSVALDRLIALNPGLYRDAEVARALAHAVPMEGRDDYTLRYARLELNLGLYDAARKAFEQYLAKSPEDADVFIELAHLHYELYRFMEARETFLRAATLRPQVLELRRQAAECLIYAGRYNDALAAYRELAGQSASEDIIGPYIRLAESLGRYDDYTRGLRLRIDHSPTPSARDYQLLAYGYELADDPADREATIAEGLRRAPPSDDLILQLAVTLAGQKNYQRAEAALAPHKGLHSDATAATLYLELMRLNNDTAAERRYLEDPLDPAIASDEAVLERVARAREALRDYPEAERIWRALLAIRPGDFDHAAALARVLLTRGRPVEAHRLLEPFLREPTPEILKLAAEVSEAAGDHRSAEKYQLAYLDAVRTAPATEWGALGDIRLARGDRSGAKRAYAEALRRLQGQIAAKGAGP